MLKDAKGTKLVLLGTGAGPGGQGPERTRKMTSHVVLSNGAAYVLDCGIGVTDQSLQQLLGNPVRGKILVLGAIILFLQWKPAGLFVTKSRSLES